MRTGSSPRTAARRFRRSTAATRSPAAAPALTKPVPVTYEYNSNVVDANALQPKFDEMVKAGWEVLSVTTAETALDQGVENRPRLIVEKYLVVGRRPAK